MAATTSTVGVPKIKFYVDIVSPFAYIAWHVLEPQTAPIFKQCEITFIPVFLGGIMRATDNRPPLMIKNKNVWIAKDRLRWTTLLNVPIRDGMPANFPANTLLISRALTALTQVHPSALRPAIASLYSAYWLQHDVVNEPEVLTRILANTPTTSTSSTNTTAPTTTTTTAVQLGVSSSSSSTTLASPTTAPASEGELLGEEQAKRVVELAGSDDIKAKLTEQTDEAIKSGAFGLPWFVVTNTKGETDGFWGVDHMGVMIDFLGLERPKDSAGFRAML